MYFNSGHFLTTRQNASPSKQLLQMNFSDTWTKRKHPVLVDLWATVIVFGCLNKNHLV